MSKKYEIVNNKYTVAAKSGRLIEIPVEKHKELLIDYCVVKDKVESICLKFGLSRSNLERYRRMLGFSRDSIPVSDEEVVELTEEELANLIVERKAAALELAQDLYLDKITKDAINWQKFQSGVLKPFESAIKNFNPKGPIKLAATKTIKNGRWFVLSLNDLQIGLSADKRDLFRQEDWSTEKAKRALAGLLSKISEDVRNDKIGFEGCVIALLGDLFHGLMGKTEKGTLLEVDTYRATQCDAILDILYSFIEKLHEIFGNIVVHSVGGNHGFSYDYPVVMAVKNYFRTIKTIQINVHSTRTAVFKISNTLILMDHGASGMFKADIPRNGKQRESYLQSLILSKSKEYSSCNGALVISADKHHFEQIEFNDFEFIMMGALPMGDIYSDNLNLNSRARQNCLIIDKSGLKAVLHYYIDTCI